LVLHPADSEIGRSGDPDPALIESAHVARRLADANCQHAIGPDCGWYHGTWQYLRALGVLKTAGGHATFFRDTLCALAARHDVRRVLISGAADDAMALIAIEAFRESSAALELTVIDRCETPLALSQWSAAREGADVRTCRCNVLEFDSPAPFDLIMTSSFLAFVDDAHRPQLFAGWSSLLRAGGKLLFTNRLRPGAPDAPVGFSNEQAEKFCSRVQREAECLQHVLGVDPALLTGWSREYAARLTAFPLRSVDEVNALLKDTGFAPDSLDTAMLQEERAADTQAGPSSTGRGDYVRVLATKL
jgi:hypothetical protein